MATQLASHGLRLRGSCHPLAVCGGITYQEQRRGPDEHEVVLVGEHLGQLVVEPVQHVAQRLVVQVAADLSGEARGGIRQTTGLLIMKPTSACLHTQAAHRPAVEHGLVGGLTGAGQQALDDGAGDQRLCKGKADIIIPRTADVLLTLACGSSISMAAGRDSP